MARTLAFEKREVLDAAMQVFWIKGYQGTSMQDLERATKLKPGSIYHSFKSKKQLFLNVLDHYTQNIVGKRITHILNKGNATEGINAFFHSVYEDIAADNLVGCMLTNTATELGASDTHIQSAVLAGIEKIEAAFYLRLREAQKSGQLALDKDIPEIALHLTSCFQGLVVIARLTRDKQRLKIIADNALAVLN